MTHPADSTFWNDARKEIIRLDEPLRPSFDHGHFLFIRYGAIVDSICTRFVAADGFRKVRLRLLSLVHPSSQLHGY